MPIYSLVVMDKKEKEAYLLLLHRDFVEIRIISNKYQHQWWNLT